MIDHIKTLLLNPDNVPGYRKVTDSTVDAVLARFGITGSSSSDDTAVERVLPLAMAPDLACFRGPFDKRVTPRDPESPYRQTGDSLSTGSLYADVLTGDGRWVVSGLFQVRDMSVQSVFDDLHDAAFSRDAPYALGAVLLACAYRRLILQGGV